MGTERLFSVLTRHGAAEFPILPNNLAQWLLLGPCALVFDRGMISGRQFGGDGRRAACLFPRRGPDYWQEAVTIPHRVPKCRSGCDTWAPKMDCRHTPVRRDFRCPALSSRRRRASQGGVEHRDEDGRHEYRTDRNKRAVSVRPSSEQYKISCVILTSQTSPVPSLDRLYFPRDATRFNSGRSPGPSILQC